MFENKLLKTPKKRVLGGNGFKESNILFFYYGHPNLDLT